jgi:hypothetical protein
MNWRVVGLICGLYAEPGVAQQATLLGNPCAIMDSAWLDPLNLAENPSAVSVIRSVQAGIFAGRYNEVKGLNVMSFAIALPVSEVGVGLVVHHTGTAGYQQNEVNLLMAKKLGQFSLGIIFRSEIISIRSVGGYHSIDCGLGFMKSSGQLNFGASVTGIGLQKKEQLAGRTRRLRASSQCLFKVSGIVAIGILASKETEHSILIQPAVYYRAGNLNFSVGFDTYNSHYFLLTGWIHKRYECKIMLGYQANLGVNSGVEFLYKRMQ